MAKTIADVRAAGYVVALASGSVEVEQEALEASRQTSSPEAVAADAQTVVLEVGQAAAAQGVQGDELAELISKATIHAITSLRGAADERVAFHERALEIAREMPDVYFVSTPDDDIQLYVACKDDGTGWDENAQEMIDALAANPAE